MAITEYYKNGNCQKTAKHGEEWRGRTGRLLSILLLSVGNLTERWWLYNCVYCFMSLKAWKYNTGLFKFQNTRRKILDLFSRITFRRIYFCFILFQSFETKHFNVFWTLTLSVFYAQTHLIAKFMASPNSLICCKAVQSLTNPLLCPFTSFSLIL
jgi:hypothetical protein